jgi:ketosteroid isomerase-like protein
MGKIVIIEFTEISAFAKEISALVNENDIYAYVGYYVPTYVTVPPVLSQARTTIMKIKKHMTTADTSSDDGIAQRFSKTKK